MTPAAEIGNQPDAVGLTVARAAQRVAAPDTVILFGSRARGDHRANSDVDLLIVYNDSSITPRGDVRQAIREYFAAHPPALSVDIVTMSRDRFDYCSRAQNHVAGQALQDGIIMSGEELECGSDYDDGYPTDWPDIKQRLINAYRNLRMFELGIAELPEDQESYGFHAQQAVENVTKAWMSAAGLRYRRAHDLDEIAAMIFSDPQQANSLAGHQLQVLMGYTTGPDPDDPYRNKNWLTRYAVDYRYSGTGYRRDDLDRSRFRQEINLAVHTIINHVYDITGTNLSDLQ